MRVAVALIVLEVRRLALVELGCLHGRARGCAVLRYLPVTAQPVMRRLLVVNVDAVRIVLTMIIPVAALRNAASDVNFLPGYVWHLCLLVRLSATLSVILLNLLLLRLDLLTFRIFLLRLILLKLLLFALFLNLSFLDHPHDRLVRMAIPLAQALHLVLILVGGELILDGELLFEGADLVFHRHLGEDRLPAALLGLLRIGGLID